MNIILICAGVIPLAVVIAKVHAGMRRQRHTLNILYARAMYPYLYPEDKQSVEAVALNILQRNCARDSHRVWNRLNDWQRFSLYALAMAELDIEPIGKQYRWSYVSHPLAIPENIEIEAELFDKDPIDPTLMYAKCIYWAEPDTVVNRVKRTLRNMLP